MDIKKWGVIAAAVLVIVIIIFVMLILSWMRNNTNHINVYFFNPVAMQLEAEPRPLTEGDHQIQGVIGYLHSGPVRSAALVSMWPHILAPEPEDLISHVKLEGSTLLTFFSPVFNEMMPLEQSLFKAAYIHTMKGLPSVSEIKIVVTDDYSHAFEIVIRDLSEEDDDIPGTYDEDYTPYIPQIVYDDSHAGVLLEPLDPPISPRMIADYTFNHLHFVDITGTGLIIETYFAQEIDRWDEPLAIFAFDLLRDGPHPEDALLLIPPETRVLQLEIDTLTNEMYINLSIEFYSRFTGSREHANLMIHSIVNTLIAEVRVPISRVFFLIETQQLEYFHGVEDFHTAFVRDNTLLLSYIEALEYEIWDEIE